MGEWEDFSGVREWNWTLTGRVECVKEVDEEGNGTDVGGLVALWDVEAETCSQQGPAHVGEGEEEQSSSTEGVDGPDGWESEDEVDDTKTP